MHLIAKGLQFENVKSQILSRRLFKSRLIDEIMLQLFDPARLKSTSVQNLVKRNLRANKRSLPLLQFRNIGFTVRLTCFYALFTNVFFLIINN